MSKISIAVEMTKFPCHNDYDSSCPGLFMDVVDGEIVCNDCGMRLLDLLDVGYPNKGETSVERATVAAKPLIKYLNENHHPHTKAIVTPSSVEVLEGTISNPNITEFIKD